MKKSEARKEEILDVANHLFFQKGYDATSVRMIMRDVGCEIGLFYYYFKNKDDIFDQVLDLFFERYKRDYAAIADSAKRDPFRAMGRFFEYMVTETNKFRDEYVGKLHRTIRWSIREQTLTIIAPYLRQIIETLMSYGARPKLEPEVLSVMLAHGVGSFILHEESTWMFEVKQEVQKAVNLLMGLDPEYADIMFPFYATMQDRDGIEKLLLTRAKDFPGMKEECIPQLLEEKISNQEIFVIRHQGETVGCIGFSREGNAIDFLVTKQELEHRGVATRLFVTGTAQFPIGTELASCVVKEEEPVETVERFLKRFGWSMEQQIMVNGRHCQKVKMVVRER